MICQRCAKEQPDVHTCTPSPFVRGLEEIMDLRTRQTAEWILRARELEAALKELVALKDLKDRAYAIDDEAAALSGRDEYLLRKPLAWDAARAALTKALP